MLSPWFSHWGCDSVVLRIALDLPARRWLEPSPGAGRWGHRWGEPLNEGAEHGYHRPGCSVFNLLPTWYLSLSLSFSLARSLSLTLSRSLFPRTYSRFNGNVFTRCTLFLLIRSTLTLEFRQPGANCIQWLSFYVVRKTVSSIEAWADRDGAYFIFSGVEAFCYSCDLSSRGFSFGKQLAQLTSAVLTSIPVRRKLSGFLLDKSIEKRCFDCAKWFLDLANGEEGKSLGASVFVGVVRLERNLRWKIERGDREMHAEIVRVSTQPTVHGLYAMCMGDITSADGCKGRETRVQCVLDSPRFLLLLLLHLLPSLLHSFDTTRSGACSPSRKPRSLSISLSFYIFLALSLSCDICSLSGATRETR